MTVLKAVALIETRKNKFSIGFQYIMYKHTKMYGLSLYIIS